MHDAYMVGDKWERAKSDDLKDRAVCQHDDVEESMNHILSLCSRPGRKEIWSLTRRILEKRGIEWWEPTIGMIVSCGIPIMVSEDGRRLTGNERLYRIVMCLSARLIWTLRCERVIANDGRDFDPYEIEGRWIKAIEERCEMDFEMADSKRYDKRALDLRVVKQTWEGLGITTPKVPRQASRGGLAGMSYWSDGTAVRDESDEEGEDGDVNFGAVPDW